MSLIWEYPLHFLFGSMAATFLLGLWLQDWLRRRLARRRAAFVGEMERRGYERVDPRSGDWERLLSLALPGAEQGRRELEGESLGDPFRYVEEAFEFDALRSRERPERLSGLVHCRARLRFSTWAHVRGRKGRDGMSRTFLTGEALPLPVPERILAWTNARPRYAHLDVRARRLGLDVEPPSPAAGDRPLLRAVRAAVERSQAPPLIQLRLFLGPRGWVVETDAWRSAERLDLALSLADAIGEAVRRSSGSRDASHG